MKNLQRYLPGIEPGKILVATNDLCVYEISLEDYLSPDPVDLGGITGPHEKVKTHSLMTFLGIKKTLLGNDLIVFLKEEGNICFRMADTMKRYVYVLEDPA